MTLYNELMESLVEDLSQESSTSEDGILDLVHLDDSKEGATLIGKDVRRVLDKNKINYVVIGENIDNQKSLDNAVIDGVYHEELDTSKNKKIKIIYDDTPNIKTDADVYVVSNESIAESMEAQGFNVARYPNQILDFIKK